ncbi:response regulator transcription factor [Tranquillimonas alkanivorans]|uniref:DNA-binding response regulator, OmpR family, contains REC and winged-helix (WHTH) domain n=1 Tax=Tranquillimonas alkanivorans TaxID=441119 RepID=A0A1I5RXR0_9RHOB|nr:response regulator transcription factor [Tranquillimonas alkanivorans]SFP63207.1 DNA-binding response regulator, OmpR family, contains REC and winged-helix (wHTH) domain [Tranquillimonas alkanivorans]
MDRPQVVILEDDADVAALLATTLERDELVVHRACDCAGFEVMRTQLSPELFIIDVGLPDGDGIAMARRTRLESDAGIIILTGRSGELDTVLGLESGADDYVAKPFRMREFRARVKSVLRRVQQRRGVQARHEHLLPFGDWTLDRGRRRLTGRDDAEIELTRSEFEVLSVLLESRRQVLTRDQIVERVRGEGWAVNDRLIDGIVSRIRKKLGVSDATDPIRTVRGVGYVIDTA